METDGRQWPGRRRVSGAHLICEFFLSQVSISLEFSGNSLRRSPIALSTLAR